MCIHLWLLFFNVSSLKGNLAIFYWSIIDLWFCISFCYTRKWIRYMYTHIPSLSDLPPTPTILTKWFPCAFVAPSLTPTTVYTCPFSMSVSLFLPCKWNHLYHFSRFHIHWLIYNSHLSLSELFHSLTDSRSPHIYFLSFYGWVLYYPIVYMYYSSLPIQLSVDI